VRGEIELQGQGVTKEPKLDKEFLESIKHEAESRQESIRHLEPAVVKFSRELAKDEVKSRESFIKHEYFMKISDSLFQELTPTRQLMFLALWACQRGQSAPGNEFWFECKNRIGDMAADFIVYHRCEDISRRVAVECEESDLEGQTNGQLAKDGEVKLEGPGFPVLKFTEAEIWQDPLAQADKVFSFLDKQIQNGIGVGPQ